MHRYLILMIVLQYFAFLRKSYVQKNIRLYKATDYHRNEATNHVKENL